MAYIRENLNAYLRELIDDRLESPYGQFMPMLYFLGLADKENRKYFGRPGTSMVLGGSYGLGRAQRQLLSNSEGHQFPFQKVEPNDGAAITYGGSTPTASDFAEDRVGTAETRWTHFIEPVKVREHSLNFANGELAIRSIMEDAVGQTWERLLKRINAALWSGTIATAANQALHLWSTTLGITHVLTAGNIYARVDRAVETNLDPLVIDSTTAFETTLVDLSVLRKINEGFTDYTTSTTNYVGLRHKSRNGRGANLHVTTPAIWNVLADEADTSVQITTAGIPNTGMQGFDQPVIISGQNMVISSDDCPSGTIEHLNLDTWLMELHGKYNFTFNKEWVLKSEVEEGGEHYLWNNLHAMIRLTCRVPWLNARTHGLTTT